MRLLEVKNKKVAQRLADRLIKKGKVVAQVEEVKELNKELVKKANVVIVVRNSEGISEALD
ncbi:MAG: hypothetical protein D6699_03345 [Aquificota bacterium]|nr:MAG: hypothetical protein D6699_03345 [Aquificota bacterium]